MTNKVLFLRFCLVGLINTGVDVGLFNILVLLNLQAILAGVVATSAAMAVSYFLNGKHVFKDENVKDWKKALRFTLVTVTGVYVIQYGLMTLIDSHFGDDIARLINEHTSFGAHKDILALNVAKAIGFTVGIAWNFLLYKYFVFKAREKTHNNVEEQE